MNVYYEVINGSIYVCNRNHNVKQPACVNITGLTEDQKRAVCDSMNAVYRAGYTEAMNCVRAIIDQKEVQYRAQLEKTTN